MDSIYLDTAIAMVMVLLLFSVLAYAIQEWLSSVRQLRGKMLEYAIYEVLNDGLNKSFGVLLYEHPQVDLLKQTQNSMPSYMPSSNFATALIDIIGRESVTVAYQTNPETGRLEEKLIGMSGDAFIRFVAGVDKLNHSDLKILLQSFLMNSTSYTNLQTTIENWFNQYMDRVSGWYRKKTSYTVGVIAVVLVLAFNFDAIYLVQNIYTDAQLRNKLVAVAQNTVNNPAQINAIIGQDITKKLAALDSVHIKNKKDNPVEQKKVDSTYNTDKTKLLESTLNTTHQQVSAEIKAIDTLQLPIGWKFDNKGVHFKESFPGKNRPYWSILLGWILAAVLISFGAPFWFNLLLKLVPLRNTGVKPDADKSGK